MKRNSFTKTTFLLLCILFYQFAVAQNAKQDCFTTHKNQGDVYSKAKNYDLAIKEYQNAKYCNKLTDPQRKLLDSLIADVKKKQQPVRINRRY
jgi:hypothetical protein